MNASDKLVTKLGDTAIAAGKMAAAAQTGGATEAAESAATRAGNISEASSGASLKGMVNSIGDLAQGGGCGNRHFDIIEDEEGNLVFLTK